MTKEITKRQEMVLAFIKDFLQIKGFPPTLREIAAHLKISSLKAVERHLTALEKKGCIKRTNNISRAIEVVGQKLFPQVKEIPIAGIVQAGLPNLAIENILGTIALDASLARFDNAFFLRVRGESMIEAHIQEGDLALVKPQIEADNGDIVVALIGDEATLKIFYREANRIRLQPANSQMQPIFVYPEEPSFSIIGKVIGILREEKYLSPLFRKKF